MEFAVDANGVKISGWQLHLGFTGSRWMLLLQHHEEDLLWEPSSPASSGGGEEAGVGLARVSRLSLTQTTLALTNPVFEF